MIGRSGFWGEGKGGLLAHHSTEYKADKRQHQENAKFGNFLTVVVSGVIF